MTWKQSLLSPVCCWTAIALLMLVRLSVAMEGTEPEPADAPQVQPNAAVAEKRKLSERILQNTTGVRDKLTGKELGATTQRQQQDVVEDLQALVDLLKKSPPPPPQQNPDSNSNSDSSPDSPNQEQNSPQKSQPKSSRNSSSKGAGGEQNRSQPQDSEERQGESRESQQRTDRKRHLENDVWGHLPPNLREEMLNFYGERMLPQYENFVRKFYETLSEPSRARKRSPE